MKKRIVLFTVAFFLLLFFVLIENHVIRVMIVISFIMAVYLKSSERAYKRYKILKFPGTVGSMLRNYDNLVLGKASLRKLVNKHLGMSGETLDLMAIGRNFFTDRLIFERYFSFLKPSGKAIFCVDCGDAAYLNNKHISRFDEIGLHEVTLWENGIDIRSREYVKTEKINSCFFLISRLLKYNRKINMVSNLPVEEMVEIKKFCEIRNICVQFVLFHSDGIDAKNIYAKLDGSVTIAS